MTEFEKAAEVESNTPITVHPANVDSSDDLIHPSSALSIDNTKELIINYVPSTTVERLTQIRWALTSIKWAVKSLLTEKEHQENLSVVRKLAPSILKLRYDQLEVSVVKAKAELDPSSITCPYKTWEENEGNET